MPGWLTGLTYRLPERLTSDEARRRRFESTLSQQRKELEARTVPLSPANKFHLSKLKEFELKFGDEIQSRRREVNALKSKGDVDPRRLNAAVSGLFQRLQQRVVLQTRADAERRRNQRSSLLKAAAADRRFYYPGSSYFRNPRSVFGTEALVRVSTGSSARNRFARGVLSVPCIQRVVRKEVLFAKRKAGRGYRGRHRFNPLSHIGC